MPLALTLGRLWSRAEASRCLRPVPKLLRTPLRATRPSCRAFSYQTSSRSLPRSWRTSRVAPRTLMAISGGGLAAAAFVELADGGHDVTGEKLAPELPHAVIRSTSSKNEDPSRWLGHRAILFLDFYIWEPVCIGFRFLQLLIIFVPVIVTVPAIWVGSRIPERDNERPGTLWWYGFLVQAMEWAGPAFIKVGTETPFAATVEELTEGIFSLANGPLQGPTSSRLRCATSCRSFMRTPRPTLSEPQNG